MRHYSYLFLSFAISFLLFSTPLHAADFNIKLRKTDINELKQQLLPTFEQNIAYLNELLSCLEYGKKVDTCLNEFALTIDGNKTDGNKSADSALKKERNDKIKQNIENKIKENNIQPEQLIAELKKLLAEAEKVKQCLQKGQTANELKDCIVKR